MKSAGNRGNGTPTKLAGSPITTDHDRFWFGASGGGGGGGGGAWGGALFILFLALLLFFVRCLLTSFSNVILDSSDKAWWTREFTKEYLPFVVSNSSLSILEGMLEKQGIYRVTKLTSK